MTINAIDETQRKAARIAGFTFLSGIVIVILANYGSNMRLIVPGDAADTARNILAHETLFRINIACNLLYAANLLVLLAALYVVLKPVHRTLALVALCSRLLVAIAWCVIALNTLGVLRLLGDTAYLKVFSAEQLQSMARLNIATGFDAYYIGLPFWGLASTVCSILWFKSKLVPRSLAVFGIVSSAWCVLTAFAYIALPNFDKTVGLSWFDVPLVLFEVALGVWLLVRGVKPSGMATAGRVS